MAKMSNLAYDENYLYSGASAPVPVRKNSPNIYIKTREEALAAQKQRKKTQAKAKMKHNTAVILLILGAFLVLSRYAVITERSGQLRVNEKELARLEAINKKNQFEIEQVLDLNNIEKIASERLGMKRPEKYQTVYISINKTGGVERTSKDK